MTAQELIDQLNALPPHKKSWEVCISDSDYARVAIDKVDMGSGCGGAFIAIVSAETLFDDDDDDFGWGFNPGIKLKAEETAKG